MTWEDAIEKDGFAILPKVFGSEEIERLLEGISAVAPRRSRAGVRHALELSPFAELAQQPSLIETARAVLGPAAFPYRATLFDKSPKSNWLVVWHQDTALPLREHRETAGWGPWSVKEGIAYAHAPTAALEQILALRIHLDRSTRLNGPLRVLPGTHTLGVLDDDRVHELATKMPQVECLVPAGGVLAMRPLLIHSSSKSQVEAERRVLHIEYAASPSIAAPLDLAVT
ncbi:MAG: phytanoyl-CoA dioxygenase family protein [Candidatus Sulfotelmatobacter sp.]